MISSFAWLLLYGLLSKTLLGINPVDVSTNVAFLASHLLFGILTAYLAAKKMNPTPE